MEWLPSVIQAHKQASQGQKPWVTVSRPVGGILQCAFRESHRVTQKVVTCTFAIPCHEVPANSVRTWATIGPRGTVLIPSSRSVIASLVTRNLSSSGSREPPDRRVPSDAPLWESSTGGSCGHPFAYSSADPRHSRNPFPIRDAWLTRRPTSQGRDNRRSGVAAPRGPSRFRCDVLFSRCPPDRQLDGRRPADQA